MVSLSFLHFVCAKSVICLWNLNTYVCAFPLSLFCCARRAAISEIEYSKAVTRLSFCVNNFSSLMPTFLFSLNRHVAFFFFVDFRCCVVEKVTDSMWMRAAQHRNFCLSIERVKRYGVVASPYVSHNIPSPISSIYTTQKNFSISFPSSFSRSSSSFTTLLFNVQCRPNPSFFWVNDNEVILNIFFFLAFRMCLSRILCW